MTNIDLTKIVLCFLLFNFFFLLGSDFFTVMSDNYNVSYVKKYQTLNETHTFADTIDTNVRKQVDESGKYADTDEIKVSPLSAINRLLNAGSTINKFTGNVLKEIPIANWAKEHIMIVIIISVTLAVIAALWRYKI